MQHWRRFSKRIHQWRIPELSTGTWKDLHGGGLPQQGPGAEPLVGSSGRSPRPRKLNTFNHPTVFFICKFALTMRESQSTWYTYRLRCGMHFSLYPSTEYTNGSWISKQYRTKSSSRMAGKRHGSVQVKRPRDEEKKTNSESLRARCCMQQWSAVATQWADT